MALASLLEQLTVKANAGLRANLDAETQSELAQLISLLPELHGPLADHRTFAAMDVAMSALFATPPNIHLAVRIREKIQQHVRDGNSLGHSRVVTSGIAKVLLGLGALFIVVSLVSMALYQLYQDCTILPCGDPKAPGGEIILPIGVLLLGAVGGAVSIMTRVDKFSTMSRADPWVLFCTGFFKPIIGMSFAFLTFTLLNAKIISLASAQVGSSEFGYLSLALAFLAGFSERFAGDIAAKVGLLAAEPDGH